MSRIKLIMSDIDALFWIKSPIRFLFDRTDATFKTM